MDPRRHGEFVGPAGAVVAHRDGGEDLVGPSVERREHAGRLGAVGGLAQDGVAEEDEGVGGETTAVGIPLRDGGGLERGVLRGEEADRQARVLVFLDLGASNAEAVAGFGKQVAPPRDPEARMSAGASLMR